MITGYAMGKSSTGLYGTSNGILCAPAGSQRRRVRQFGGYVLLLLLTSCAKHFPASGMVIAVNAPEQTVTISHRDIPHYMPAMAMPVHVRKSADLSNLHPGAQIEFELVARKSGSYVQHLRRIGGSAVIEDQGDRIVLP